MPATSWRSSCRRTSADVVVLRTAAQRWSASRRMTTHRPGIAVRGRETKTYQILIYNSELPESVGRLMTQRRPRAGPRDREAPRFLIVETIRTASWSMSRMPTRLRIKSRDHEGRVLYLGTFSKVLAGSAVRLDRRTEVARRSHRDREAGRRSLLRHARSIDHRRILRRGELPAQIERGPRVLSAGKREIMLDALQRHFEGRAQWTAASGGLFTFMTLKDAIDTATCVEKAIANGVAFVPVTFFVDGATEHHAADVRRSGERIREGIASYPTSS